MKKIFCTLVLLMATMMPGQTKEYKFGVNYTYSYMPLGWAFEQAFPKVAKKLGVDASVKMTNFPNSKTGFGLLLNDQLDFMVASPTLVNNYEVKDPNVVKFLIPMNFHNAGLRCRGYKSIAEIKAKPPVVAVPGRQVTNHMVLQWIGEHHLGNKNFFEDRIVVLKTQQMLQVIKSGSNEIDCVVWGSPLQNQLTEEDGLNLIVETDDIKYFPGFVNMVVVKKSWADANPKVAEAIIETIKVVNKKWNKDPYPYLKMYIEKSKIKGDPKKMTQWYKDSRMVGNTTVPAGLDRNLRFANEIGFIKQLGYKDLADLFWKPELLDKN